MVSDYFWKPLHLPDICINTHVKPPAQYLKCNRWPVNISWKNEGVESSNVLLACKCTSPNRKQCRFSPHFPLYFQSLLGTFKFLNPTSLSLLMTEFKTTGGNRLFWEFRKLCQSRSPIWPWTNQFHLWASVSISEEESK